MLEVATMGDEIKIPMKGLPSNVHRNCSHKPDRPRTENLGRPLGDHKVVAKDGPSSSGPPRRIGGVLLRLVC